MDITQLIRLRTAADLIGYPPEVLSYYKAAGRFCKPHTIDGVNFYLKEEVEQWKPKQLRVGRKKRQ